MYIYSLVYKMHTLMHIFDVHVFMHILYVHACMHMHIWDVHMFVHMVYVHIFMYILGVHICIQILHVHLFTHISETRKVKPIVASKAVIFDVVCWFIPTSEAWSLWMMSIFASQSFLSLIVLNWVFISDSQSSYVFPEMLSHKLHWIHPLIERYVHE